MDEDRMCPAAGKEISTDICYELWMCLNGMFKVSSVPEVSIDNAEHARDVCSRCPHRKEWI